MNEEPSKDLSRFEVIVIIICSVLTLFLCMAYNVVSSFENDFAPLAKVAFKKENHRACYHLTYPLNYGGYYCITYHKDKPESDVLTEKPTMH
jgi:hypothetical protein